LLTDIRCKKARGKEKPYKLSDSHGLYLYVTPAGYRSWRLKYRFAGKEHRLTLGSYPEVSLVSAREAREQARNLLRQGINPKVDRRQRQAAALVAVGNTFEAVAREWHRLQAETLTPRYHKAVMERLEANVFQAIGPLPIAAITPALVLTLVRAIEDRGARDMAHRVRQHLSAIFCFAIGAGMVSTDPADIIQASMKPRQRKRRPAMTQLDHVRQVLKTVDGAQDVYVVSKLASRLLALTAVRPGVLRLAEPHEFEGLDSTQPLWRVPAAKMKLTRTRKMDSAFEFVVPLSKQAVQTIAVARGYAGASKWLFPSPQDPRRSINDTTLSKLYRDIGLQGKHVPHGWRASFSTIMNAIAAEEGRVGDRDIIDLMLAHMKDDVEAAYNRYAYMPRRRELAQEWADLLMEGAPAPETLHRP